MLQNFTVIVLILTKKLMMKKVRMKKKGLEPKQFKITNMEDNKLPKSLESRNDFNEAKKLINDIRIDKNNVEVRYKDKKAFNDLNR